MRTSRQAPAVITVQRDHGARPGTPRATATMAAGHGRRIPGRVTTVRPAGQATAESPVTAGAQKTVRAAKRAALTARPPGKEKGCDHD